MRRDGNEPVRALAEQGETESLVSLPTERVKAIVMQIAELYNDAESNGVMNNIKDTLDGVAELFCTWDRETRQLFILEIVARESDLLPRFEEYVKRREAGKKFPFGSNFSAGFLGSLTPEQRQITFWGCLEELTRDIDFKFENDPNISYTNHFCSAIKTFPKSEKPFVEHKLFQDYAHDPAISSDGKWTAFAEYFRGKYGLSNANSFWEKVQKDTQNPDAVGEFLLLQKDILGIICDNSLGDDFRGAMLEHLSSAACTEEIRSDLEAVLLEVGQPYNVSREILDWIMFRSNSQPDKGSRSYGVAQNVVETRTDQPAIRLRAIQDLMLDNLTYVRTDSRYFDPEIRVQIDLPHFIEIEKTIAQNTPEALKKEGSGFFVLLARMPEGVSYLREIIAGGGTRAEKIMAYRAALVIDKSLLTQGGVREVLVEVAEELESGNHAEYLADFIFHLDIYKWQFTKEDLFIIRRLEIALEPIVKAVDEGTIEDPVPYNMNTAQESVLKIIGSLKDS